MLVNFQEIIILDVHIFVWRVEEAEYAVCIYTYFSIHVRTDDSEVVFGDVTDNGRL